MKKMRKRKGHVFSVSVLLLFSLALGNGSAAFLTTGKKVSMASTRTNLRLHASTTVDRPVVSLPPPVGKNNATSSSSFSDDDSILPLDVLAKHVTTCLVQSELKRDSGFDGASTGWTSWVEESSALELQSCMDKLILADPTNSRQSSDPTTNVLLSSLEERDQQQQWIRWMKACPCPTMLELSNELRHAVNQFIDDDILTKIDSTRNNFLRRMSFKVILLPSGTSLPPESLTTPPGAMAHGKLFYGGVSRYRLVGRNNKRRAGERSVVYDETCKSWLQYGGPERNYQAMDMGPCALAELILTPKGLSLPLLSEEEQQNGMAVCNVGWNTFRMFELIKEDETQMNNGVNNGSNSSSGVDADHVDMVHTTFTSSVGGLRPQIESIVRRVLDGRVIRPAADFDDAESQYLERTKEAKDLAELGLTPVRGLLLYGPPGCGKTLLAREISKSLNARPPKIVEAPALLDRWVGGSEKLIRDLFADAETELAQCDDDPTQSALHVIVIDEIDAVFRRRTAAHDSGEATRASAVNQILSKLDGVKELGNVLLIGLTNRKELLDDALLRPGRLEVQVEIPLPDQEGRREILQIQFDALRKSGRLSRPLCRAIDGTWHRDDAPTLWRKLPGTSGGLRRIRDLSHQRWTGGFSGADIAGLMRCAGSIALARTRAEGNGIDTLVVTLEDVRLALEEVKQ